DRLLFAGEHLHIVAQCALVALQREDVVGLLVDDPLRDVALATHGVDGHHRAPDGQQLEQRRNGDDLVGLVADLVCPSTMRWRAAKAETTWMGSSAPFF